MHDIYWYIVRKIGQKHFEEVTELEYLASHLTTTTIYSFFCEQIVLERSPQAPPYQTVKLFSFSCEQVSVLGLDFTFTGLFGWKETKRRQMSLT